MKGGLEVIVFSGKGQSEHILDSGTVEQGFSGSAKMDAKLCGRAPTK